MAVLVFFGLVFSIVFSIARYRDKQDTKPDLFNPPSKGNPLPNPWWRD